jgi:hypothetical protein
MKTAVCAVIILLVAFAVFPASGVVVQIPKVPKTQATIPHITPAKFGVKLPVAKLTIPKVTGAKFGVKIPSTKVTIPAVTPAKFGVKLPGTRLTIPNVAPSNFLSHLFQYILAIRVR